MSELINLKNAKAKQVLSHFANHPKYPDVLNAMNNSMHIGWSGLHGSSFSVLLASYFQNNSDHWLLIEENRERAAYVLNDLEMLLPHASIHFFPASFKRIAKDNAIDSSALVLRTDTLNHLSSSKAKTIVVTYPEALIEKIVSQKDLKQNTLKLQVNEAVNVSFISELLFSYEFTQVDFVAEPGQFSIRGSIVDIFSFSSDLPFRVDFFGDTVESIRTFDVDSQLSLDELKKVNIIPDIQNKNIVEQEMSLFDYLPKNCNLYVHDLTWMKTSIDAANHQWDKLISNTGPEGEMDYQLNMSFFTSKSVLDLMHGFKKIEYGERISELADPIIQFDSENQPNFNKNFEKFRDDISEFYTEGYNIYIFSSNDKQTQRLINILHDINLDDEVEVHFINTAIHEGFIDHEIKVCVLTDHQLFERYHKYKLRGNVSKKDGFTLRELTSLQPGDYVVHSDHGIGVFAGLAKVDKNGEFQEVIRLSFQNNDALLVSIHNLHKISKYRGKDGETPKISKLGGVAWENMKKKTKSRVKDIARELIALYARRKTQDGFAFSPDSYLQTELEASFIYEDTPDQEKTTQAIKDDMEAAIPMDRLVCGDVGFGKTELAIRAAFKSAVDGKQVAVLVPTTILAMQHFYTFKNRLENMPVRVDYISRFRKAKEQTQIIKDLKEGKIDILIGTHRLIGKDIEFKDLGLLVIDEEQKFGVAVKEKLKAMKVNVDTLTLTATPIPRTLQFSMLGARDLSVINTPPPNRHPVLTEVHSFDPEIIRQAINYEMNRGGQVFLIHNRVQNIFDVEAMVNKLCPKVKTIVGHGQMEGKKLEQIMMGFIQGDYDVLIATTIIESGLDIPNANTIIINDAQNYGLSDLHQLRGRVGRSNKKAFCYLMSPPIHSLPADARRRLRAIEEFSDLGSGFQIAMQDLDIRGAGNLLGAEQSGFINEIGLETYQRILDEAILELKQGEFADLFQHEIKQSKSDQRFVYDCNVETDLGLTFSDDYIQNVAERIRLYRELDKLESEEELINFEKSLIDRFGPLPPSAGELMDVVRLRWVAVKLGIEKLLLKNGKMIAYFVSDQESKYYESYQFTNVLQFVQKNSHLCRMKEANNRLSLSFDHVKSVKKSLELLRRIMNN